MDAPIYVLTSDKYLDALRPFAFLLNRYWQPNPQVIVGGFSPPGFGLPPNFRFVSLGKFEDYPVNRWSDALIHLLLQLPHPIYTLMLEDYWITQPVDVQAVQVCVDYMHQFEYVTRLDLTGDRLNSGFAKDYGLAGDVRLLISDPESQYHMSLMAALWRRERMLSILVANESPWEVELNGTPRLRALSKSTIVLGTDRWPVRHTLAFRGGEPGRIILDEIRPDDVAEMRDLGLLQAWEKR